MFMNLVLSVLRLSAMHVSALVTTQSAVNPLDPKCPTGTYPGFHAASWHFNVPAERFMDKTGSFFHGEWYTGPVNATHGKDNTVGSTRSGIYFGLTPWRDRLTIYSRSRNELVLGFAIDTDPLHIDGAIIAFYGEEMRIMSICGGTATYMSMTGVFCTDKVVQGYDEYDVARRAAVGAVANELHAYVFDGNCPVEPV